MNLQKTDFKNPLQLASWLFCRDPWASARFTAGGLLASLLEIFSYGSLLPIVQFVTTKVENQNGLVRQLNRVVQLMGMEEKLSSYLMIFGVISLLSALVYILLDFDRGRFISKLDRELRLGFMHQVIKAKWELLSRLNHGDVMNAMTREMDLCRQSYHYVFLVFSQSLLALFFLGLMCYINPTFFVVTFLLLLITYPLAWPMIQWSKRVAQVATVNASAYSDGSVNAVRALKNIKASSLEDYLMAKIEPLATRVSKDYYKNSFVVTAIRYRFFELIGLFVICMLLYLSIERFKVPVAEVLVSIAILFRLIPTVSSLMSYLSYIVSSLASFDFLNNFMLECPTESESFGENLETVREISFREVSFGYPRASLTVKNLSVTIRKGEFWAICGPTGVGKSTILDLCDQLFKPNHGKILFDGKDSILISPRAVHRRIAYLTQHHYLFAGTLRENLLWGIERVVAQDELHRAIELAQLKNFVETKTLDFLITESAQNLSGGERQRIALARTLLTRADFILMDEPSSALDLHTETLLFEALLALKGSVGLLVITHRPEFLQHIDGVIHLSSGCARIEVAKGIQG